MASSSDDDSMVEVTVKVMSSGENYTFNHNLTTLESLKQQITKRLDIPIWEQILVHQGRLTLDNAKELKELEDDTNPGSIEMQLYAKKNNESIDVIVVTKDEGNFNFTLQSQYLVSTLKKRIDEKKGVSPPRQSLTTMGVEMLDENSLEDYIISDPIRVYLTEFLPYITDMAITVRLFCPVTGMSETMQIDSDETVFTLHGMVRRAGLAMGQDFHLMWSGFPLIGSLTLDQIHVSDNAVIYVVLD